MQEFNQILVDQLSWGLLLHAQGLSIKSKNLLSSIAEDYRNPTCPDDPTPAEAADICRRVIRHINFGPGEMVQNCDKLQERSINLLEIVQSIDSIFDGQALGHKLSVEPRVTNAGIREGSGLGYSRDPFHPLAGRSRKSAVALAAVLYLLRGHASFFCRPSSRRDFNAAKVALNDFFQCGQLCWRLYRCLRSCHAKTGDQDRYHITVLKGADTSMEPGSSDYFIWSLIQQLEIQRGNIYRQISNLGEAARFYRHFTQRLEHLEIIAESTFLCDRNRGLEGVWQDFITPSIIRAYSEASKVQFDQGYFLDSLRSQVLALAYIVKDSALRMELKVDMSILNDCNAILSLLEAENRQQVIETELILEKFRPKATARSIYPERFYGFVDKEYLAFAADMLARMGFTLLTLQGKSKGMVKGNREVNWLKSYALAADTLTMNQNISPSDHTLYLANLLDLDIMGQSPYALESIELRFVHHLREAGSTTSAVNRIKKNPPFHTKVLWSTTENILNLVTIPKKIQQYIMRQGYRKRRLTGDLSKKTVYEGIKAALELEESECREGHGPQDKIVILRRWQSINPRIPRPDSHNLRGGGYFLIWQGKGIVIDPGYDFILNFYEEGFSLDDIDAVIVTHSHPDHDDDLSTLTTLCREWNEHHRLTGKSEVESKGVKRQGKTESMNKTTKLIDFFLNESTNLKFSAWLKSSEVQIGRVIPLPSVWWDKDSEVPWGGRIRGEPVIVRLRDERGGYSFNLEVIPAWHNDVIGKTEAIGLKFHLYRPGLNKPVGIIGITGDTGAFGHDLAERGYEQPPAIENFYKDCDVLLAHLGDVKIRELTTMLEASFERHPVQKLFSQVFPYEMTKRMSAKKRALSLMKSVTPAQVESFLDFLLTLDLIPKEALLQKIRLSFRAEHTVREWLTPKLLLKGGHHSCGIRKSDLVQTICEASYDVLRKMKFGAKDDSAVERVNETENQIGRVLIHLNDNDKVNDRLVAWSLMAFLCALSTMPWQYPYHLGVYGMQLLFKSLVDHWKNFKKRDGRIFIVGELPEELASHRNLVAWHLNELSINKSAGQNSAKRWIRVLTGDIGLHVKLEISGRNNLKPKIRCTYCNYNNETVLAGQNYHDPSEMAEVPIKRLNSAMIYLCRKHGFGRHNIRGKRYFLSRPNLRVV